MQKTTTIVLVAGDERSGADAYVRQPFAMREVVIRVQRLLEAVRNQGV